MSVEFVRIETENLQDISRGYFIAKNHYEHSISTEIAMLRSGFILTRSLRILPNTSLTEEINFADACFYSDVYTYKK